MPPGKLNSILAIQDKQKLLPATVLDVLGFLCSVRVSTTGKKLTGLQYAGSIPSVGSNVWVDYRGRTIPIVLTSTGGETSNVVSSPTTVSSNSAPSEQGSGTGGTEFPESDGLYYVAKNGAWIEMPQIDSAPATTAINDLQLGDGNGAWIKKTLAEAQNILGTLPTKRIVQLKVVDDDTVIITGDGQLIFCVPSEFNEYNIYSVDAFVSEPSNSGAVTVQIRNITKSVDVLSTPITIDQGENTSYTAVTAPVINTSNDDVATGNLLAIDINGAGTMAQGLGITLTFKLPYEAAEYIYAKKTIQLKIFDDTSSPIVGDAWHILCIPADLNGFNLVDANAFVTTVSSSGAITVQVRNITDAVDMLSTGITIDQSENTSYTGATQRVINASNDNVSTGDLIGIDVDTIGSGAKGLGVILSFQLPQ